ncbi:MAG: hypothetical protein WC936_07025 [Candidatus Nanoarchaeia archaeon]|jgi:hypothetical protein
MKEGDKCPSCPGGILYPSLFVPVKGVTLPVLVCQWCGYQCKDENAVQRPVRTKAENQATLEAI